MAVRILGDARNGTREQQNEQNTREHDNKDTRRARKEEARGNGREEGEGAKYKEMTRYLLVTRQVSTCAHSTKRCGGGVWSEKERDGENRRKETMQ